MEKSLCIIFNKNIPKLAQSTKGGVSDAGRSRAIPLSCEIPCQLGLQACLWEEGDRSQCPQTFHGRELHSQDMGGGKQRVFHSMAATFLILKTFI